MSCSWYEQLFCLFLFGLVTQPLFACMRNDELEQPAAATATFDRDCRSVWPQAFPFDTTSGLPSCSGDNITGVDVPWDLHRPQRQANNQAQAGAAFFFTPSPRTSDDRSVEWGGLMVDSTRFLLFQHAFRLATEKDTRAGLSGPFFRDYKNSVLNIHGWNDGDPFFVNYIDHPMEGSVAGFLEIAHDPRSRDLEIGKSSAYWKSRLRATAFSAAFSLQFEIGPVSEASIGNIQLDPKKTGIVDWVITPTVGLGWMLGEDAIDKYFVKRWESHTQSHFKRILLRGILNPSRSFSNMMQGKVPWHRDTRPGVSEF